MNTVIVVLSILILQFAGEYFSSEPASEQMSSNQTKASVSEISSVEKRGNKAPNFAWTDGSGKRTSFSQFHKNVTVLNFWATWCGPCRREIPDLEAIHKEYGRKGVKVIGVSVDRGPDILDEVSDFAANFKMTYPVVIDNGELERLYGNIRAIPTTFIINKDGKIVEKLVGLCSKEQFLKSITPHL